MNISVYLNDGEVISSVDINEATVEEALSAIKTFGFGENKEDLTDEYERLKKAYEILQLDCKYYMGNYSRCSDELNSLKDALNDVQEECDCWKEKYKIECQHNDEIKKAYDELVKDVDDLIEERDEYKEIASDRDDLKVQLDDANLTIENLRVNRDEWYNSYTDEEKMCATLRKGNDKLLEKNERLKKRVNELYGTLSYYMNKEHDECQTKSES